jgi:DNA-binding MarR family transcriptional regulator/FixJ family two-component response regulator
MRMAGENPRSALAPSASSRLAAEGILDRPVLLAAKDGDALAGLLAHRGYKVLPAADAAAAARLWSDHPDIAVIVIELDHAGIAVLEALRRRTDGSDSVEYVLVAGKDALPAAARAREAGVSDILARPVTDEQFAVAVSEAYNVARLKKFRREEARSLEASIAEFQIRVHAAMSELLAQARKNGVLPADAPDAISPDGARLKAFLAEEGRRVRQRQRIFGPIAASHAAWLLLLTLSDASLTGRELTIKAAAYSAGIPLSSALRKINEMCAAGLMKRRGDPADARRSIVVLTQKGRSFFEQYCSDAAHGPMGDAADKPPGARPGRPSLKRLSAH